MIKKLKKLKKKDNKVKVIHQKTKNNNIYQLILI